MDIWRIRGGRRLDGTCFVQGSKNATLPITAASLVVPAGSELLNVPQLRDVDAALRIVRHLGCTAEQRGGDVYIDSTQLSYCAIPHDLMEEMRSSVIFMGALLARCGEARLSLPGGCQLGKRPIDLHLAALRGLGAEIEENGREIYCREPEVTALQEYLNLLGADISGAGTGDICIRGMEPETQVCFRIMPDRIVASTLACAAAACGGDVELRGVNPAHFSTVLYFLNQSGCDIISNKRSVRLISDGRLKAVEEISTAPYPGFPTDAQPVLMAALLKAEGRTLIIENIFENRFRQAAELRRLGADITVSGRRAEIWGVDRLLGTMLNATDLRGGAAMIIAGLCAEGETVVCDDGHVTRGYERFDRKLRSLGADVNLEY